MTKLDVRTYVLAFLEKYKFWVHALITAWTGFVMSWASGISVPLSELGLPINMNARAVISAIQLYAHIPTWVMTGLIFAINVSLMYINWKKSHVEVVQVPPGSVLVASPAAESSIPDEEKTVIEVKDGSGNSKTIQ